MSSDELSKVILARTSNLLSVHTYYILRIVQYNVCGLILVLSEALVNRDLLEASYFTFKTSCKEKPQAAAMHDGHRPSLLGIFSFFFLSKTPKLNRRQFIIMAKAEDE